MQAYQTLTNSDKKKLYQRILTDAWNRTLFERGIANEKRVKAGLEILPEETFMTDFAINSRRVFEDIEDKRNHLLKMDLNLIEKRNEEIQTYGLKEQYRLLTEEEWEKGREHRIKKWKDFKNKGNKIGTRTSDMSVRLPKKNFEQEKRF